MRPAARHRVAVLVGGCLAAAALLSACAPAAARTDPTDAVRAYLQAIADGDVSAARAFDDTAVSESTSDAVETETLRQDAVLAGAVERIGDVVVDAEARPIAGETDDWRSIHASVTLDGETYETEIVVVWDGAAARWRVAENPLVENVSVLAQSPSEGAVLIGFRLPGAEVPAVTDQAAAPLQYAAYPAVYEISTDPPGGGDANTQRVVVTPDAETTVTFELADAPSPG